MQNLKKVLCLNSFVCEIVFNALSRNFLWAPKLMVLKFKNKTDTLTLNKESYKLIENKF